MGCKDGYHLGSVGTDGCPACSCLARKWAFDRCVGESKYTRVLSQNKISVLVRVRVI